MIKLAAISLAVLSVTCSLVFFYKMNTTWQYAKGYFDGIFSERSKSKR